MEVNLISFNNKISYGAGVYSAQRKFINNLNVADFEKKLAEQTGVKCDFHDNRVIAGLTGKTIKICQKLGITLPESVEARKFNFKDRNTVGLAVCRQKHIEFNTKFFKSLEKTEKFQESRFELNRNKHILSTFLHEFLHVHHYNVLQAAKDFPLHKYLEYYFFKRFENEIREKVGYNATINPIELYATFWSKEICDSLDKNWMPKYNPFHTPKTQLSPQALKFVCSLEDEMKAMDAICE